MTKAYVEGLKEGKKHEGNVLDIVFGKNCNSLREIFEAVELAFDKDADTIILKRIRKAP